MGKGGKEGGREGDGVSSVLLADIRVLMLMFDGGRQEDEKRCWLVDVDTGRNGVRGFSFLALSESSNIMCEAVSEVCLSLR
jgi:hypothetical protein